MINLDVNTCLATTDAYRTLALFSHLIPAAATLILGFFAYANAQNKLKGAFFLAFAVAFAAWLTSDLIIWTSDNYGLVAAFWEPMDYIEIAFFVLLFGFFCVDLFGNTLPRWLYVTALLALATPFIITVSGNASSDFYQPQCEMLNSELLGNYKLVLEFIILAATFLLGVFRIFHSVGKNEKIRVALVSMSITLFLGIFGSTEYIASQTAVYEINLYALFTLPVFVLLLTMAITSYGTFRLGDAGVKVLFYVFLTLATTQFFYVDTLLDFYLALMSFGVVLVLGIMLFRAVGKEIAARHIIETQEQELEIANAQQESLLHFISHEIKGYLAKNEAGFAAIKDGDYGEVPAPLRTMATLALADTRKGVATVMDILDASNLKKGTVTYTKNSFDMAEVVEQIVADLKSAATERGLQLYYSKPATPCMFVGDEAKIRQNVVRNIIDNSIKYTPSGSVDVALTQIPARLRITVSDTGVGITPDDMGRLFTEGGHGVDSIKINVHSTGYGLYIAKTIVEAHKGKIWAESEGKGKGSKFIIELPTA